MLALMEPSATWTPFNAETRVLVGADGRPHRVTSRYLYRALARLCAEPGRVVSHADLVRSIYEEEMHDAANILYYREPLRSWIRELRRLLRQAAYPNTTLITYRNQGYQLNLDAMNAAYAKVGKV